MVATYRLFENDKVRLENVLQPHIDATRIRIAAQPVVILAQDTSELDLTRPQQQVRGAGPLDGGPRHGVLLHLLHGFTPDGTPLGTLAAQVWARENLPLPSKEERAARRKQTPIEDKESQRWVDMLRQVQAEARLAPQTRFVCVSDSESDIFELLAEAQAEPRNAEWVVRAAKTGRCKVRRKPGKTPLRRRQRRPSCSSDFCSSRCCTTTRYTFVAASQRSDAPGTAGNSHARRGQPRSKSALCASCCRHLGDRLESCRTFRSTWCWCARSTRPRVSRPWSGCC